MMEIFECNGKHEHDFKFLEDIIEFAIERIDVESKLPNSYIKTHHPKGVLITICSSLIINLFRASSRPPSKEEALNMIADLLCDISTLTLEGMNQNYDDRNKELH